MLYALNKPMKGMRWESFVQPKKEEHNLALWFNIKDKIVCLILSEWHGLNGTLNWTREVANPCEQEYWGIIQTKHVTLVPYSNRSSSWFILVRSC